MTKWKCSTCADNFALSEVQVDHLQPILNNSPQSINEFIDSFKKLHSIELQVLCKECHKFKTRCDLYNAKYKKAIEDISDYFRLNPKFVAENVLKWETIKKFQKLISNFHVAKNDNKRAIISRKIDKLKMDYL